MPLSINRIRLEFKVDRDIVENNVVFVLIESDWNLKLPLDAAFVHPTKGINRIRLEFKVNKEVGTGLLLNVLIESDWNLNCAPFRVYSNTSM